MQQIGLGNIEPGVRNIEGKQKGCVQRHRAGDRVLLGILLAKRADLLAHCQSRIVDAIMEVAEALAIGIERPGRLVVPINPPANRRQRDKKSQRRTDNSQRPKTVGSNHQFPGGWTR